MLLEEACRFAQELTEVTVTMVRTPSEAAAFCGRWQFHDVQDQLVPATLFETLRTLPPDEVLCLIDRLRVRFVYLKIEGVPVVVGPYCTERMTEADFTLLRRKYRLPELPARDFLAYRGQLPGRTEAEVLHLAACLTNHTGGALPAPVLHHLDTAETGDDTPDVPYEEASLRRSYPLQVEERYKTELQLMEAIRQGDRTAALASWKQLHSAVSYLKVHSERTLETARISAAITRTTIRLAASEAGLPAVLNDQLSSESSGRLRLATTVAEIDEEHSRLIRSYCKVIHDYHTNRYSTLVLSATHAIERHYRDNFSIAALAEELEVSENHLIRTFKRETGTTPKQYLLGVRMRQASRLLRDRDMQVQQVSAAVGIPDSNYFAKRFRAQYGESPQQFQKHSRL